MTPNLDTLGMVRTSDPETSRAAARGIKPLRPLVRDRILTIFRDWIGGTTDQALIQLYRDLHGPCAESTIRTRRHELSAAGALELVGIAMIGNRPAQVWRLKR